MPKKSAAKEAFELLTYNVGRGPDAAAQRESGSVPDRLAEIIDLADRAERGEVTITPLTGLSDEELDRVLFGDMPRG